MPEQPQEDEALDPAGEIAAPTSTDLPDGYHYGVTRYADVVISEALPGRWADLLDALSQYRIDLDELRKGGGARSSFVSRFDDSLGSREVDGDRYWGVRNITIEKSIGFDDNLHLVARTRGHEIDMFGQRRMDDPFPGIAVEMEWNNKDPFFDRDLVNFQALHREGAIVAGVIVTRGPRLQRVLSTVLDKYGASTTHWDKLTPRVNLGGGGECPLLLIGIEPERVNAVDADGVDLFEMHMSYAAEAKELEKSWRDMGYESRKDAQPEIDSLKNRAKISRLPRDDA